MHLPGRACPWLSAVVALVLTAAWAGAQVGGMAEAERLVAAGKWVDAERVLQPIAAAEAQNFRAYLLLGLARYKQGNLSDAARSLTTARMLRPEDADAARLLGDVRYAEGDLRRAVQAYEQARVNGADDAQTWYRLGLAHQRLGRGVEAQQTLYAAALRFPNDAPIIAALARVDLELGRASEAAYWFKKATALKPTDTGLFREMIDALIQAGSLLTAQTELKSYLAKRPNDADALRSLARVYTGLGLSVEARDVYTKLQAIGALTQADREALFANLIRGALWEQALAQYAQLVGSRDANIHDAAAGACAQLGRYDDAAAALLRAEAISPAPDRKRMLAGIYSAAGRHEDAYRLYSALLGNGNDTELIAATAGSALKAGRSTEAIALLNLLAATDPGSSGLRQLVAETAERAGDLREALKQWSIAAELQTPDGQTSHLALARIAAAAGYRTWALEQLVRLDLARLSPAQLTGVALLANDLADGGTAVRAAARVLEADGAEAGHYAAAGDMLLRWGAADRAGRLAQRYSAAQSDTALAEVYARWLIATADPRKALSVCKRALAADPQSPVLCATALDAGEAAGLWGPLADIFTVALGEKADNPVAADFLRMSWEKGHGVERAAAEMDALARLHPASTALASAAGRALKEARRWAEAAEYYQRLIGGRGRPAAVEAAECYIRDGRLAKARSILLQAIPDTAGKQTILSLAETAPLDAALELLAQQPGSVLYYLTVAKLFAAEGRTAEGIAFFERLAAAESIPQAHVARAYLLYWKRDYAQAINDLQGLPTSVAADPDAALLLAWAYLGAGNYVAAKATAYGVISSDIVTQRGVYEVAGQAAMRMGDAEGALDHFCLALSAGSRSAVAADGIRELCRMRMVPYSSVRRQLTQVYRYSDDPDPVLQLARGLSQLSGYERLERWVRDRAGTVG